MFNEEDIYDRLLAGESADDIAKELTDMLNAAQTKFAEEAARKAEEEAKAALAKAERESKKAAKREALKQLIADTIVFIAEYYPAFGITMDAVDEVDDETLDALADLLMLTLDLESLKPSKRSFNLNGKDLFGTMDSEVKPAPKATKPAKPKTDEDVFNDFFAMLGL